VSSGSVAAGAVVTTSDDEQNDEQDEDDECDAREDLDPARGAQGRFHGTQFTRRYV
jgi:hypothetical protein